MKMRLLFWLCIMLISATPIAPISAQQGARIALVIGNANYPDAPLSAQGGCLRAPLRLN